MAGVLLCACGQPAAAPGTLTTPAGPVRALWTLPDGPMPTVQGIEQVLPGGLRLATVEPGSGDPPAPGDLVTLQYHAWHADTGALLDSSATTGHPVTFAVGMRRMIRAWDEALLHVPQGARVRLVAPAALAYKELGLDQRIPPHTDVVFDLWLLGVARR